MEQKTDRVRRSFEIISDDKAVAALSICVDVLRELQPHERQANLNYLQSFYGTPEVKDR